MSKFSRRTLVQLSIAPLAAQDHSHDHAGKVSGASGAGLTARTNFFTSAEFEALRTLCDLILPADDVSPAASAAGAPEYIEALCSRNSRLAQIFRGGLAWLNHQSYARGGQSFATASDEQRIQILDRIAGRRRASLEDSAGAEFFDWARKLTIDAFYTSPAGYKDVDYRGGKGMTVYQVPEAVLEQALTKAKLK